MRKFLQKTMILGCVAALAISVISLNPISVSAATKNVTRFNYSTKSDINKITLKWKKQKGVSYYKVYRAKSGKDVYKEPKKSAYKKIAKIKTTKIIDKKVKKDVIYSYKIKGYKKQKGKDKLICSSYYDGVYSTGATGLVKPEIFNGGYGENYSNSPKELHIYAYAYTGIEPEGYILYRKAVGEKKYKKVTKVKGNEMTDDTVKAGETYYYKVKSYSKKGGKTYYSKKSKSIKISAVNLTAKCKVEALSQASVNKNTVSFMLESNDKYNGDMVIKTGNATYIYQDKKGSDEIEYTFTLTKYSLDNKVWYDIPKKGIVLKANQKIYLEGTLSNGEIIRGDKKVSDIFFGGTTSYESELHFESTRVIEYKGSGIAGEIIFDFITGDVRTFFD
jgi:hypothetical protein